MEELLSAFGFEGGIRLLRRSPSSSRSGSVLLANHYESDLIMKSLVSRPYISTRPFANVFVGTSTINNVHSKGAMADVMIGMYSHRLLGAARKKRYIGTTSR